MRIVIMSDSHRRFSSLQRIIEQQPDADIFIDLGDSEGGIDMAKAIYPGKTFYGVRGNCDFDISLPSDLAVPADEKYSIFASHGHRYHVNYSRDDLVAEARKNNCLIACYGHTHVRESTYSDGMYILNPGSCTCPRDGRPPSYAFIDITDGGVFITHVDLKNT